MHAMKRQLALSLLLLILSLPAIAQDHTIAGKVVDETGAGISFATIARCNPSDSTVIGGLVADEMGRFTLDGVSLPALLRISSLGYQASYRRVESTTSTLVIQLVADPALLDDLMVIGERKSLSPTTGGLRMSVEGTILATKASMRDLLLTLPGIVDDNGSLRSLVSGSVTYYINGRKVRRMEEVKQLDPKRIKSVSLITNPGVKYPGTTGAVVEIQSNERLQGLSSTLGASYTRNHLNSHREWCNLAYQSDRVSLFGNLGYNRFGRAARQDMTYTQWAPPREDMSTLLLSKTYMNTLSMGTGISYRPSKRWEVTLDGSRDSYHMQDLGDASYEISESGTPSLTSSSHSSLSERGSQSQVTLTGRYTLSERLRVDLSADYLDTRADRRQSVDESTPGETSRLVTTTNGSRYRLLAGIGQVHYSLGDHGNLLVGDEVNLIHLSATTTGLPRMTDQETGYDETVNALYAEYTHSLDRVSLSGGLRYEYQRTEMSETGGVASYGNILPYLALSFSSGIWSHNLSIRSVALRPSLGQLSNSTYYLNKYNSQVGNPDLKRQLMTTLQYVVSVRSFYASGKLTRTKDPIFVTYRTDPTDRHRFINSWDNFEGDYWSGSLLANFNHRYGIYNPNISLGLFGSSAAVRVGDEVKRLSRPQPYLHLGNSLILGHVDMSLDYTYIGKGYSGIFLVEPVHYLDLSVHGSLPSKGLDLTLKWHDPLRKHISRYATQIGDIGFAQVEDQDLSYISATITWRFSSKENKQRRSTVKSSERNRL